jgi:hypothetical protein
MRLRLPILLLAALLAVPAPVRAGVVAVDPVNRRVETTHLIVRFDLDCPEVLRQVVYKGWSPTADLSADESSQFEFWGQTARGLSGPSHIRPLDLLIGDWVVVSQSDSQVVIGIESVTDFEPTVTTRYTFHADLPWFDVERTVSFNELPESTAYQAYLPRVAIVTSSRALRFRDTNGGVVQRAYCFAGCETAGWDGRWLLHCGWTGTDELAVASIYADDDPEQGPDFVRGRGPLSGSDWLAPLRPARLRDTADRARVRIVFGRDTEAYGWLDSLHTAFNEEGTPLAVAPPHTAPARLRATPNPAPGPVDLDFTLAAATTVRLGVFDASGRRVRALHEGPLAAGRHHRRWDGRDGEGRVAAPGLYLVRLESLGLPPRTLRIARMR